MDPSRGPDVDVDAVVTYLNVLREVRRNLLYKLLYYTYIMVYERATWCRIVVD